MEPVKVFCCGEVLVCTQHINTCDSCVTDYNIEGDKLNVRHPWYDINEFDQEGDHIITVNDNLRHA